MSNIIYKVFRGDELMKIDADKYTVDNLYHNKYNQRIYGSIIIIKEDGIYVNDDNESQPVSAGDCLFLNYNQSVIIKNDALYKAVELEIEKQKEHEKNCCVSETKKLCN